MSTSSSSTTSGDRVQKIIAEYGLGSRREAEQWIKMGEVSINGKVAKLGDKATAGVDHIKVRGKLLQLHNMKKVVLAFYKPRGVLSHKPVDSTAEKPVALENVFDYLEKVKERVFPVGQLDKDAEGLLLMTNDGELSRRLSSEKFEVPKVYKVKIDGKLDDKRIKRLSGHMKIEETLLKIVDIKALKELEGKQWVRIKLTNSQNRLIRKMFEAVGRPVDKVRRMSFAGISIEGMERGEYRYLSLEEIDRIYGYVGLNAKI